MWLTGCGPLTPDEEHYILSNPRRSDLNTVADSQALCSLLLLHLFLVFAATSLVPVLSIFPVLGIFIKRFSFHSQPLRVPSHPFSHLKIILPSFSPSRVALPSELLASFLSWMKGAIHSRPPNVYNGDQTNAVTQNVSERMAERMTALEGCGESQEASGSQGD